MLAFFVWMVLLTAALLVYPRRPRTAGVLIGSMGVWTYLLPYLPWNNQRVNTGYWTAWWMAAFWLRVGPDLDRALQQQRAAGRAPRLLDREEDVRNNVTERQKDGFDSLGLIEPLAKAVTALGYEEPTPVQRETIPLLLAERDVLAQAATGTGKTAAFALPMLQRSGRGRRGRQAAPAGSCSCRRASWRCRSPKRSTSTRKRRRRHASCRVYGGAPISQQIRTLERGAGIVVATPGRALDHIRRGTLKLDRPARARARRSGRDARHGLRRGPRRDPRGDARRRGRRRCSRRRCRRASCRSRSAT